MSSGRCPDRGPRDAAHAPGGALAVTADALGVRVFPELAHAALRCGLEGRLATWAVLRTQSGAGVGWVERDAALAALVTGRGVTRDHAARLLDAGVPNFWKLSKGRVWLSAPDKVAAQLGVERVSAARDLDPEDLRSGRAALRAALYATVYRVDERGSPLTRRKVREITGVPASTQRRYDRWGHTELVSTVNVVLTHVDEGVARSIPDAYPGWGFHIGRHGELLRRHGDIRRAVRQRLATRSSAKRVNTELARNGRPALWARGERPLRSQFRLRTAGTSTATAWLKEKRALGKRATRREAFDPVLAYSALEQRTRRGRRFWTSAADPPQPSDIV